MDLKNIKLFRKISISLLLIMLFLSLIKNTQTLIYIDQSIFRRSNLIIAILMLTLLINTRVSSLILVIYAISVLTIEVFPRILEIMHNEFLYFDLNIGSGISYQLRSDNQIKNNFTWCIIRLFGGLNILLSIFILFVEIPFRMIHRKQTQNPSKI